MWVQEVMTQVTSEEMYVGIEERQVDVDERATVTTMVESTCGCRKRNRVPTFVLPVVC